MDDQYVTTLVEEQQIQILTGQDNYASWAQDILFVLQSRDAVDIVTGQEALPVQPDPDKKDKHVEEDIKDWMSRDKYARSVIGLTRCG
ncbi:hypothetical protein FRC02_005051 [Tulasnella sp. 418]|nr:hypothetical protein FRC02_005051 [Tulasnella sp. 418]